MNKPILDMTAGSRMFWWNKHNSLAIFFDYRRAVFKVDDNSHGKHGIRTIKIDPDIQGDWTEGLPFADCSFSLVVFDPPHLLRAGESSWLRAKYGVLNQETWQQDLRTGMNEAMRVLKPFGTLIFKWNDEQIKLGKVLKVIGRQPLFGDKRSKTHWLVFMKDGEPND